ncbi:MAG: glycosyltransferase family 29 protein [Planctomycetia bacterium]|nr:glycosyltransferase family 29 protein [Planctomycetia bacterium]
MSRTIVISSGCGVLKYEAGNIIDSFDEVVRCNEGFHKNCEKYHLFTGTKTTKLALNPRCLLDKQVQHAITQTHGYEGVREIIAVNFNIDRPMYPELDKMSLYPGKTLIETDWKTSRQIHLGTGFPRSCCGVIAAMHEYVTTGEVWLYGFLPVDPLTHFYDDHEFCLTAPGISNRKWIEVENTFLRSLPNVHFLEDELQ